VLRAQVAAVALLALLAATAVVAGCGGDSAASLPEPEEIARCFEDEGAEAVDEKVEEGTPTVTALTPDDGPIAIQLSGDEQKADESIEALGGLGGLEVFPVFDGEAVAAAVADKPAAKRLILSCVEQAKQ
jgi:hypothetical protein